MKRFINIIRARFSTKKNPVHFATDNSGTRDLELAISHAKDGYRNAQETIKFIDTKSTFLGGITVLTIGATLEAVKEYLGGTGDAAKQLEVIASSHPYCSLIMRASVAFSLVAGVVSLYSCALSLYGRLPKQDKTRIQTVLFPVFAGTTEERRVCERIVEGMTKAEIAMEYDNQLWNVGIIVYQKLLRHRWAIRMFVVEIALLAASGIVVLICTGF